jgi:flagellar basal body-associated protein FliL
MAEIDPIMERREREAQEQKNKSLKNIMWALVAVAALMAAGLAYVWATKSSLVKDLNAEKEDLTQQMIALRGDYESLSSDYESVNSQLDSSREEVNQLIERIQKTEATNRAKMRQYEKELGTLRSIMRGYIVQIDSLNQLNHKLTVDAANARREAAEHRKMNEQLTAQVEDLTGKVVTGSVIKARGLRLEAYNSAGKLIDRSKNVARLLVTLSLVENALAEPGPVRVYVRVKDPAGDLLDDGRGASFTLDGQTLAATASREVDYQGQEVELSIYVNNIPAFQKGIYTVEAFTSQARLGSAELMLR